MKELTKKVIILNNFSSPYVSQAIIVLRDYNPGLESKAVADAEIIVSKYIERLGRKNGQPNMAVRKKNKLFKIFFGILCVAAFGAAIYFRLIT